MKKAYRRARLSKLLSAALFLSLISIVSSAIWLPTSPANAAATIGSITNQPQWVGGGGGNQDINCSAGSILRGIYSGYNTGYPALTAVQALCDPLNAAGTGTTNSPTESTAYGGSDTTGQNTYTTNCGANSVIIGVDAYSSSSSYVSYVTPICGALPLGNNATKPAQWLGVSTSTDHELLQCSAGTVAIGLHLNVGGIEDRIGLNCAAISGATQTIAFNQPATQTTSSSLTVTATTTSTSTITFTSATPAVCTVTTGGIITFVSAGTCTLTANAGADTNYASNTLSQSFTVLQAANNPTISTQPSNLSKTSPQAASLVVAATGNGTLTYQWQVKVGGTGSFANVTYGSGGTTSSYALDVTRYTNGDQYQVIVTNTLNGTSASATSTTATLTLASALSITTPSTGLNAVAGTPFSLNFSTSLTTGGRTPYTFSNTGTLPAGITLTNSTTGIISGTPTTVGTSTFTTTVTDSNSATATTNSYSIVVSPASTTTSFTAGAAYYNLPDTLTATVISLSTLPVVGTVTFKDAANNTLCSTSSFNAGVASCAWIPASTNPFNITAYFVDGAGNYASSQSSTSSVTPGKASITESVSASSAVVAGGSGASALIMTATLNPTGSATVGGSVAFTVNGVSACPSAGVSLSIATCSYSALGAGIQNISAVFSGDSTFNGANASTTTTVSLCNVTVTVNTYLTGAPGAGYCAVAFTSGTNGTWTVPTGVTNAQVLIVGGGGAGGERAGGGGGAGELLYTTTGTPLALTSATDTITVGAGGQIETTGERGSVGGASSFATSTTYSAYGGGYGGGGGGAGTCGATGGSSGGNDGGASYCTTNNSATGHSSYSGFTSLVGNGAFGTDNNAGGNAEHWSGGGGGGAGSAGSAGVTSNSYTGSGTSRKYTTAGSGGSGASVAIALNSPTGCYAAGGGGGVDANSGNYDLGNVAGSGGGCGATIIGGNGTAGGALSNGTNYATAGFANTGSGGGGSGFTDTYISPNYMDGRAGAGGSGVVIVKYLSPSIITTNWDASGDTMTVTSGTSLTLTETSTVFGFTRTTQWQYSVNNGVTWTLETATATAGANSSSGNSSPILSYTFVIRCGLNTGSCKSATSQYLFRAIVIDTDAATNLVTNSYSPTITVNVTARAFTSTFGISSTSTSYIANSPFTLATYGGNGTGAISYVLSGSGTATGCSITGSALRVTSAGNCKVIATQAADLDYLVESSTVTIVSFYVYIAYTNQYTAPVGSHGIGGTVSGGGINNTQTTGSTVLSVTGMSPTSGAVGTSIVITGTGFQTGGVSNITQVSFNSGLDLVAFVVNSPTQITLTLPSGEAGVVDQFALQPINGATVYSPTFTGL